MRKLKEIFSRQYVKDAVEAFYVKNLADKEKRRVFGFNVGSTLVSAAFGMGVMAAVKAATMATIATLAGASTAFTLGAATAAGAPVAAVLTGLTVAAGLTSGLFRNISDRKALAMAGQPVPKFFSRENGKAFFAKGNLLTMGLSAGASLLGGLFVVDFAPQTPSAGPAQAFNSMATQPATVAVVAPAIESSTAVAADALKADPLTASPAPGVLSRMFERDPLGEFFGAGPSTALAPLTASAVTPPPDFVALPEPAAAVPAEVVAATAPTPPDATAADTPTVAPADPAPASAAPATVEPKAYEGQKVGECTVKEVLTGWFNESSYPPANPTSVFDMECKVAPSAQTGDYIEVNGVADYGKKFGSRVTMEWNRVRDLVGQAKLWLAPQTENRLNDHLYGGLGKVQVNASIKPLTI